MLTITSTYAETHFNEVINQAQQEPVVLTAQGQIVAYLLSPVELENCLQRKSNGTTLS